MEGVTESTFLVVGGGIAGVTCVETLSAVASEESVILLTSSHLIKAVTNYQKLTRTLETFDVEEKGSSHVEKGRPGVEVIKSVVTTLHPHKHELQTADGRVFRYKKLCVCTGGKPKVISERHEDYVLGIRDTESVKVFQKRLKNARRILVVGNGGIATEIVYEIQGCEVIWTIKDKSISSTFVDAGAAEFFLPHLNADKEETSGPLKRLKYTLDEQSGAGGGQGERGEPLGGALGPDWADSADMVGKMKTGHRVHVEYSVEVEAVVDGGELQAAGWSPSQPFQQHTHDVWPVYVRLTNGKVYGCDFIVSATGVVPNTDVIVSGNQFELCKDLGIKVNSQMETSLPDVYAAGDVCTASWEHSQHWLQMRLWSQARQMGHYAAKSMMAALNVEEISLDFCFEMFAHVTKFFNFKVVLLGLFNAQGLGDDYELLLRVTKGEEYVKVILQNGRMKGAILIGDTDLEETFENLILNELDLTPFKEHLLDSAVDIEDFFD